MMRVTMKGHNAILAMINLAVNGNGRPVPVKQIAREESLSTEYLEQIFFRMKQSGIVKSTRGPNGGFSLSVPPNMINVRMILESSGECLRIAPCTDPTDRETPDGKFCAAHVKKDFCCRANPVWTTISDSILSYLEEITLESIIAAGGKSA